MIFRVGPHAEAMVLCNIRDQVIFRCIKTAQYTQTCIAIGMLHVVLQTEYVAACETQIAKKCEKLMADITGIRNFGGNNEQNYKTKANLRTSARVITPFPSWSYSLNMYKAGEAGR